MMDILPDLIEIGFDVIDPIQPEWLDPVVVKQLYGDQITLHGYGSLQWTLPFGTLPRGGRASDRNLRDRRWMGGFASPTPSVVTCRPRMSSRGTAPDVMTTSLLCPSRN